MMKVRMKISSTVQNQLKGFFIHFSQTPEIRLTLIHIIFSLDIIIICLKLMLLKEHAATLPLEYISFLHTTYGYNKTLLFF